MAISDDLAEDFTTRAVNLLRFDGPIRREIVGNLKALELELVSQLQDFELGEVKQNAAKQRRLQALLEQTRQTIRTTYKRNRRALAKNQRELARREGAFTTATINERVGASVSTVAWTDVLLTTVSSEVLIEGAPSAEWWSRQESRLRRSFEDSMRTGILAGESTQQLVRRVRGSGTGRTARFLIDGKTVTRSVFSGGLMNTSRREAEALVRSSVQAVAQAARQATFQQNSSVIKGQQALVTLDTRTSPICISRSGFAWTLDGRPIRGTPTKGQFPGPPPWHFNCRTQLVPVMKSFRQLGRRNKARIERNAPQGTQASMNGQVAGDLTYTDWLRRQPVELQREVLGTARFEKFQAGELDLRDLIDQQTARPLRIDEL